VRNCASAFCEVRPLVLWGEQDYRYQNAENLRSKSLTGCGELKVQKKSFWSWPVGVVGAGLAGAAVVLFRGCWHSKMSWPVRAQELSYQVCLGCGIKRLFDEKTFRAYGPYSYDLNRLMSWDRDQQEAELEPVQPRAS
jgi:hypothetical protein